ncbi:DUF4845 domain-containing protein [Ottowia sp.]|uniref:DUF4845 domain-containing protein n=1 Tax=Ottowia sp. TaxID=1898956 RepID=UPI002609B80B|nr:DUF4845 domain-containing protein [Ottowia sp.]
MKHGRGRFSQRGISFIGLLILGVVLAFLAIVGARVVPTVTEFMAIQKTAKKVAADGGASPLVIKQKFDLAAAADYISSVSGKDLEVTKDGDKVVINFAYDKEIPLFGPVYLLIKYRGSSDPKFN